MPRIPTDLLVALVALSLTPAAAQHTHPPAPTAPATPAAPPPSPYVSQADSPVRGLTAQEVADLQNGAGAGYARTAELNGHPGPRHVLELRRELGLSPAVAERVQAEADRMSVRARQIGQEIVRREADLSAAFARGGLAKDDLARRTRELALLYADYRAVHLEAHLAITPLLTKEQIAKYNLLRGYTR